MYGIQNGYITLDLWQKYCQNIHWCKKHLTNREKSDTPCFKIKKQEAVIMRNLQFASLNRDDDRQRM